MEESTQNKEIDMSEAAMQIIIHAGDARLYTMEAIDAMGDENFDKAREQLKFATEKLKAAHIVHTRAIQDEARSVVQPYSLLFTHAQDTLMTIKSELLLAEHLFRCGREVEYRLDG
jgi:PTS system cellobiose-specific IIA component